MYRYGDRHGNERHEQGDVRDGGGAEIAIDYRYNEGSMSFGALRAIREAVAESPGDLLTGLDEVIALLGDAVPAAKSP